MLCAIQMIWNTNLCLYYISLSLDHHHAVAPRGIQFLFLSAQSVFFFLSKLGLKFGVIRQIRVIYLEFLSVSADFPNPLDSLKQNDQKIFEIGHYHIYIFKGGLGNVIQH